MPIEVLMPALSPTMEEGTLAKWTVKPGDTVKSGDVIAEIETDKATMEVEAVEEGVVGKLLVEEGAEGVKVNAVIALLLEEGEDESALEGAGPGGSKPSKSEKTEKSDPPSVSSAAASPAGGGGKESPDDEPSSSPARGGGGREAAGGGKSLTDPDIP